MLLQLVVMATLSDDQVKSMMPLYGLLPEDKKVEALRLARQDLTAAPLLAGKSIGALVLGIIGIGLLKGRRKPTRLLAILASVLFGAASVIVVLRFEYLMRTLESGIGLPAWVDLAFCLLVPLAFICCFIISGKKLWKAPVVATLRPRPPLRPPPPPA